MRIPGRKIWRAFPELDEFSDDQCRRFVKRAWGGWVQRTLASAFVIGTFIATLTIVGWAMAWAFHSFDLDNRKRYSDFAIGAAAAALALVVGVTAPFLAMLARDFLLRSFIWRVINIGGVCHACSYALYGLPLSERFECACPECGAVTKVDAALVELVRTDAGVSVAKKLAGVKDVRMFWTYRRLRLAAITLSTLFAVLIVLPVAILACNEVLIRFEAARARASIPTLSEHARTLGATPVRSYSGTPEATGIWKADAEFRAKTQRMLIEFAAELGRHPQGLASPDAWKLSAVSPEHQREALRRMENLGMAEHFRLLSQSPPLAAPLFYYESGGQSPSLLWSDTFLHETRGFALERMRTAAAESDREWFELSLRAAIASLRTDYATHQYGRYWLTMQGEYELWSTLRDAIAKRPELAGPAARIFDEMPIRPDWVGVIENERLSERDRALTILADANAVRFNRFTPGLARLLGFPGGLPSGRIGWVGENIRLNDKVFDAAKAPFEAAPWQRTPVPNVPSDLLLIAGNTAFTLWVLPNVDVITAMRAGARVMLAIEEYHFERGSLPAGVDDPDLKLPAEARIDPLSGRPWVFIPNPAPHDRHELRPVGGYLLYSIGTDGIDDFATSGGAPSLIRSQPVWSLRSLAGQDVLVNGTTGR